MALAALLSPRFEVTVSEKTATPTPVGAGILLQPSGMEVLGDLGVLPAVMALGAPILRLYGTLGGRHFAGWPVMDMRYSDFQRGRQGLGLSRHALTSVLLTEAQARGAVIAGGQEISGLRHGEGLAGFDLTVLANGTFSQLREQAGIAASVTPYPWGALWILLRDPEGTVGPVLRQWYRGAHQMLGLMPTGHHSFAERFAVDDGTGADPQKRSAASPPASAPWISLFWSLRADRTEAVRAQPLAKWKQELAALAPQSGKLLEQIASWDQVAWARYADVQCPTPFKGRVVCIGDAAHAMSPQLGQGCNMALIDARQLARCLLAQPDERAFATYAAARRKHLATYQFFSKWLTPMFQADGRIMPGLRNLTFWPGSRLPGSSRLAATLLTGYLGHPRD